MSAAEVRRQLIEQKEYTDDELPSRQTINTKLRELDYYPKSVVKSKPKKKIPETDAIFEQLAVVNSEADKAPDTLRLSIDAKARVKIGPFSRGGKNRVTVEASDHDFKPKATVVPFGIFLPLLNELSMYFATSRVTSDFIVDVLEMWWKSVQERFSPGLPYIGLFCPKLYGLDFKHTCIPSVRASCTSHSDWCWTLAFLVLSDI